MSSPLPLAAEESLPILQDKPEPSFLQKNKIAIIIAVVIAIVLVLVLVIGLAVGLSGGENPPSSDETKKTNADGNVNETTGGSASAVTFKKLKSKQNNKCISVDGRGSENSKGIFVYNCEDSDSMRFKVDDKKRIVFKHSNKCLDVSGAEYRNGVGLVQYDCHEGDNQKFEITTNSANNTIVLKPKAASNKCVDLDVARNQAIIWDCHGGTNQQWYWE